MSNQIGKFFVGTVGFPVRFVLTGLTGADIAAIQTMALTVTRPDATTFSGTPTIVNGAAQYVLATGDLTLPDVYAFQLILNMTSSRTLPLRGTFQVEDNP